MMRDFRGKGIGRSSSIWRTSLFLTTFPSRSRSTKRDWKEWPLLSCSPSGVGEELGILPPGADDGFKLSHFRTNPTGSSLISFGRRSPSKRAKRVKRDQDYPQGPDHCHRSRTWGRGGWSRREKREFRKRRRSFHQPKAAGCAEQTTGLSCFLTRDGDYYVAFSKRLTIVREYGADLFVSIHADAAETVRRKAVPFTVFLRTRHSEAAQILARNANLADVVAVSQWRKRGRF